MTNAATVLVTGGLGFIGRHVVRYMHLQGHRVIGVGHGDVAASGLEQIGLDRWLSGHVSRHNLDALAEPVDLIVHCAGSGVVGRSFDDPDSEFRNNVGAAADVLDFACRQRRHPRVVMLSSAAVYGVVHRLPISEDAALNPISPYGESRLAIEEKSQRASSDVGLEISIVRLFSVYGPGLQKQLFWDACRKLAKGDGRFGGNGTERRDWLHIDDTVRLIGIAAASASAEVPIINGGSGSSIKVSDALMQIRSFWSDTAPAITFSGEVRAGDPPGYEADIALAKSLGWSPDRKLAEGLSEYVSWARGVLA